MKSVRDIEEGGRKTVHQVEKRKQLHWRKKGGRRKYSHMERKETGA